MIYAKINNRSYPVAVGFRIEEQIGNRTSSTVSVLVGDRPVPAAGDTVELIDDQSGAPVFWGFCTIVRCTGREYRPAERVCELVCANANSLPARRLANVALRGKTVTEIVTRLFETYIAPDGVSLGQISDFDTQVEIYTAADLNLQKALDELAEYVGAGWNITADRRFFFLQKSDFPQAPAVLDDTSLPLFGVETACRESEMRTVQIIKGSSQTTDPQYETHLYNGHADHFTLSFPLSASPVITVNGTPVPENAVGVTGLHSGDASKAFLFSFRSATVSYNAANTSVTLHKNDVVEFEYVGFFPIRVEVSDSAHIEAVRAATGTSGIIENVTVSHSLTGWSDAQSLAEALLDDFGQPRNELVFTFDSRELTRFGLCADDFALFTVIGVRLTELNGEYVVTERRIEPVGGGGETARFRITVKCVDRSILKGYGSVLFSLKHELVGLRVCADEQVLANLNDPAALTVGEALAVFTPLFFYPAAHGCFEPADLCQTVYPV